MADQVVFDFNKAFDKAFENWIKNKFKGDSAMDDEYKNYLTEIVLKLTGRLSFAGETNVDHDVSNNLCNIEPVLDEIIKILVDNAKNRDRTEYSISRIGKESYFILKEIQDMISEID